MAHSENDDSFDRPTFMVRENSLVLFTVKYLDKTKTLETMLF